MAQQPTTEVSGAPFTLQSIAWREIFPWLLLVRCVRLAMTIPVLFLATLAIVVTPLGWRVGEALFSPGEMHRLNFSLVAAPPALPVPAETAAARVPDLPTTARIEDNWSASVRAATAQVRRVYFQLSAPFRAFFTRQLGVRELAYYVFGALVSLAVWSLFAGAITRLVGLQLARDLKLGTLEALKHAGRHFLSYFSAPLYPFVGLAILAAPLAVTGLIMRLDVGAFLAALAWPLAIIGGLVIAVLLLGLLFGWPLMWPAISLEEQGDAFEALSRSYSYTFQRPFHYLMYTLLAIFLGGLGTVFVQVFLEGVLYLTSWSASWGAGAERMAELTAPVGNPGSAPFRWAHALLLFWSGIVRLVGAAYPFAFFWTASTGIYLLLRQDTDETELDEVFVDESEARYTPQLLESLSNEVPAEPPPSQPAPE